MPKSITDKAISSGARHLFHVLKDRAKGKNWPECWPSKWLLADDLGKSVRMVQYYIQELEKAGAISIGHGKRSKNRYRILLAVNERLSSKCTDAPMQSIAELTLQSIAELTLQSIAEFEDCTSIGEATQQQAAQETEVSAVAAEENPSEEEMTKTTKNTFEKLVSLGMPATAEMAKKVDDDPDFAKDALRHCQRRFAKGKKPVDNPGGYIAALLCNPAKFGFVRRDDGWHDPEKPSGPTAEELTQMESARKASNLNDRARRQAEAEDAYADMVATWEKLPDEAKQQIRDFVMKDSPLLHDSGKNAAEFELQCMREAFSLGRTRWRKSHLANVNKS